MTDNKYNRRNYFTYIPELKQEYAKRFEQKENQMTQNLYGSVKMSKILI